MQPPECPTKTHQMQLRQLLSYTPAPLRRVKHAAAAKRCPKSENAFKLFTNILAHTR